MNGDSVKKTIVLAEDETAQQAVLEMMLMPTGHDIVTFSDGKEVLAYLKDHTPDLLILDIQMPYLDGLAICDRVKRISRLKHVPVIIMTALKEGSAKAGSQWVKADAYLEKPIKRTDLLRTVASLLSKKAASDETS